MLLTALVPDAQGHAVLQHIPNRHPWGEAQGSQGDRFHRRWGQQRCWCRVVLQPASQPGQLGAAAHRHHSVEFGQIAAVPSSSGEGGLQQLPQGIRQPALLQQGLQLAARHPQGCAIGRLFENGLLRQIRIAEATFEPFRRIQQSGQRWFIRAAGGCDPAIDVTPPQP